MSETNRRTRRIYAAAGAVVGWTALVLQLWIMVHAAIVNGTSVTAAVVRYVSFFTILSNIAVATALTASAAASRAEDSALGRPRTATALAVYITIVGAVYSLVLRRLWHPTGAQAVAD
ncbi:MAG: Pr6Pr family membrane protein, partial [Gemmatimonadota bacterium]